DDFLIITYKPTDDLFSEKILDDIEKLKNSLLKIKRVDTVTTILDVPLINSPQLNYKELDERTPVLRDKQTDIELAKIELSQGPLYKNLILNESAKTTAIQVIFKRDEIYQRLLSERNQLREKRLKENLSEDEKRLLTKLSYDFKQYSDQLQTQQAKDIVSVRQILEVHRKNAEIHLGGVPMITADMIDYIANDIQIFGVGVLVLLVVLLSLVFRKVRWVLIPMLICFAASFSMMGLLGLLDWRVSVVSSNFISLMLIITLSLAVHLIVRYREFHQNMPAAEQKTLVWETVKSKAEPAFFTAVTTMVAFASLVISGIRPVIDFGWMMMMGISLSLILAFVLFPSLVVILQPGKPDKERDVTASITGFFAKLIKRSGRSVLIFYIVLAALSILGMSWLTVENRFIDYFKKETEIYQGMVTIDRELGGTTPLDVIINAPAHFTDEPEPGNNEYEDDEDAEFFAELEA
ncbi:MAG: MMPL family transporter, partial [Gammaproteobacteria bacterium]|nr:MMPL family transporter [Gammaproteobacteria bacterium]